VTPYNLTQQILCWRHSNNTLWLYRNDMTTHVATIASGASTTLNWWLTIGGGVAARNCNMLLSHVLVYNGAGNAKVMLSVAADLAAEYFSPNAIDADHYSPLLRGAGNEQTRDTLSRRVFARSQRDKCIEWTGGPALGTYGIGDNVYLAHPRGPDPCGVAVSPALGWPNTVAGRRPHRVMKIDENADKSITLLLRPL
jgi:hypothetical protein